MVQGPNHVQHTHLFNGPLSGTTQVSRYQKGKTNLDFTEARDSEWQWHQLGHMQVCTLLQADNHASTPPLSFLQAGCPSWRPTNSDEVLVWLSICSEVQNVCIWSSWCYCIPRPRHLLLYLNPDWFCLSLTSLPRLSLKKWSLNRHFFVSLMVLFSVVC